MPTLRVAVSTPERTASFFVATNFASSAAPGGALPSGPRALAASPDSSGADTGGLVFRARAPEDLSSAISASASSMEAFSCWSWRIMSSFSAWSASFCS